MCLIPTSIQPRVLAPARLSSGTAIDPAPKKLVPIAEVPSFSKGFDGLRRTKWDPNSAVQLPPSHIHHFKPLLIHLGPLRLRYQRTTGPQRRGGASQSWKVYRICNSQAQTDETLRHQYRLRAGLAEVAVGVKRPSHNYRDQSSSCRALQELAQHGLKGCPFDTPDRTKQKRTQLASCERAFADLSTHFRNPRIWSGTREESDNHTLDYLQ